MGRRATDCKVDFTVSTEEKERLTEWARKKRLHSVGELARHALRELARREGELIEIRLRPRIGRPGAMARKERLWE